MRILTMESGEMNITGLTGCRNRVKLQRIIQVGISECAVGRIHGVAALTGFDYK